jgi:transposase
MHVGVDVSKEKLDFSAPGSKGTKTVSNNACGIRKIVAIARKNGWAVCCESTGVYSSALVEACHEAGVTVAVANPLRVRRFAQGKGILEKTDAIDACVIARYADENQPKPARRPEEDERLLRELTDGIAFYHKQIQMLLGRLEQCPRGSAIRKELEHTLLLARKTLARLEERRDKVVSANERLSRLRDRFTLVQGVGGTVAMNLMAGMPELGSLTGKEAAKLAGVAPIPNESGKSDRKRRIAQGRIDVRNSLDMAAVVASRHNPVLHGFYERLLDKGKTKKLALAAVMRKLVVLLNRIARDGDFVPLAGGCQRRTQQPRPARRGKEGAHIRAAAPDRP